MTVAQSCVLATKERYNHLCSNHDNMRPINYKLMPLLNDCKAVMPLLNDCKGVELSVSISLFSFLIPALRCEALPPLQNGSVNYLTKPSKETAGQIVQAFYSCKSGFTLEGDKNVTCNGTRGTAGKWSIGLNTTCVGKESRIFPTGFDATLISFPLVNQQTMRFSSLCGRVHLNTIFQGSKLRGKKKVRHSTKRLRQGE